MAHGDGAQPLHLLSSVAGGVAALAVLVLLGPGLVLLSQRPLRVTALTVPLFALITLMWTVLSLVASGVDSLLDPARFAVLPLRARSSPAACWPRRAPASRP